MATQSVTFTTMNHSQFTWPSPKPLLAKPAQPQRWTGLPRLYQKRMDPDACKCETHGFQSDMNRYKALADKERLLQNQVINVNIEMTNLMASVLNSCDMEEKGSVRSVYQTDYDKRGFPLANYRPIMAAVDSPIGSPINPIVTDLRDGYRDPTRFRYSAIERLNIQPAGSVDLLEVPETFFMWDQRFTGRSEYEDTISKLALSNIKSRQQYLEPLPSSRRRWGDSNL